MSMKTRAIRLYGVDDIRLEEFELPEIADDEILVKVVSDSICMSTWKTVKQGAKHKRVPDDVHENPVISATNLRGISSRSAKSGRTGSSRGRNSPSSRQFPDRWNLRDTPTSGAAEIQNTAFFPMTSSRQAVSGPMTAMRISPVPWRSRCPAASAGITQTTTQNRAVMNTSWAQRKAGTS